MAEAPGHAQPGTLAVPDAAGELHGDKWLKTPA